jgi:prolyl-tRNA synthetase
MADDKKLTTRAADFSAWYNETVLRAELADYSPVRGCMVIRPRGYGIWERMQRQLDFMFKDTGHENAYFPMLIPESFMHKEAEHVEGFSPELAVVTHGGGKKAGGAARHPSDIGDDHLFDVRQMGAELSRPADSHQSVGERRALGNENTTFPADARVPLAGGSYRSRQRGEAEEEARKMLGVYRDFMEGWMAMPVITGIKTDSERFAGALRTYSCEAMMQDNKALQAELRTTSDRTSRKPSISSSRQKQAAWITPGTRAGVSPHGWSADSYDARR